MTPKGPSEDAPKGAVGPRDWSQTLFLPKTEFSMKAGLPELEPHLLARWERAGLYRKLREAGAGRRKFVLHDGPPYANGHIHIGHALNKILKDLVVRSQTMLGEESNYVPGWDCHGLPIEWKIEEQYRAKGKNKDEVPINEFRRECREFAAHWLSVQREEFKRLGVMGAWDQPYATMDFAAEAAIARELMKFAETGQLYRGSKPVMWSVVEKTALAEAEVEYQDYQSDQVWVKFPVKPQLIVTRESRKKPTAFEVRDILARSSVVIWTTTPWTLPGNRAISYSSKIDYGVYEVTAAPEGNWAKVGETFILADKLANEVMKAAKVEDFKRLITLDSTDWDAITCAHPLHALGYTFDVPLLDGDHVTDDTGTGFVHTAPGHGADDYKIWMENAGKLRIKQIDTAIPFTVDADGVFTKDAPGFTGRRVLTETGDKGDANDAVIKALQEVKQESGQQVHMIIARGRLKHQYPHSWRSKKPVIFRNTPQWFIAMDQRLSDAGIGGNGNPFLEKTDTLRHRALAAIDAATWIPETGRNRIRAMIESRPDWVVSRQRAWGVPITVFRNTETDEVIPGPGFSKNDALIRRIEHAFAESGADVWFEAGAKERFLKGIVPDPAKWEQVRDVLDVWFDSGSTHAFTLEDAQRFPGLANICRVVDGGEDRVMYLEGSDQHRGWFQSSLLESCGTRGHAPYDLVLTHGFILDEKADKMSKSKGNVLSPQDVMKTSGADILRLWVAASDTTNDIRFGPEIVNSSVDAYRKLRNSLRFMLGSLAHFHKRDREADPPDMPSLERYMRHRLAELGDEVRAAYAGFEYRRVVSALAQFLNTELSAFYFDIRRDALYCEPWSSGKRRAALSVIEDIFQDVTLWLAPILSFTAEEAWLARYGDDAQSVHLQPFPDPEPSWRDPALAETWETIRRARRVVTGALEIARADKQIGSSLEAAPDVYVSDKDIRAALKGIDFAEVCITSGIKIVAKKPPAAAFALPEVPGVGVVVKLAKGAKCARSRRYTDDVGSDPDFPDLSARDAAAVREFDATPT